MKNEYEVRGEVTAIFLKHKNEKVECLIDTEDFEKVDSIKGSWSVFKHHTGKFYVRTSFDINKKRTRIFLHRFIMQPSEEMVIDHINHNPLDNRKNNLRVLTNAQNKQNLSGARRNSTSGVRGVSYKAKDKLWEAGIKVDGKQKYLGVFKNKEEAIKVVEEARKKYMPHSQEALTE